MRTTLQTTNLKLQVLFIFQFLLLSLPDALLATNESYAIFAPVIEEGQSFNISEGSLEGTAVGTVSASDASSNIIFSITDADAPGSNSPANDSPIIPMNMFIIDNNGLITVNDATYLLASVGPVELTIEVRNAQNQTSSAIVTVNITDIAVQTSASENLSWSSGTPQPLGNSEGQSEVVNGKMYSFSGFDIEKRPDYTPTERAYVFDPTQNTWTLLNPMPMMHPNSAHGGVTHAGFTNDGTHIYFAGGYAANANGNGQIFGTKYVYKYIVASDTYERLPDLPIARAAGDLEYINGKLYYFGGTNTARNEEQGDLFVLDLNNLNGGWTNLTNSPLPNPRNHLGSAVVNNKLYVVGGQHKQDAELTTQDDVHMFDPATGVWTKVTDLPDIGEVPANLTPGKGHITNSTFAYNNQIFVLGGEYQFLGPYSKSVMAYNPATHVWTRYTDMPTVRSSGVAGVINGVLYYSTGRNSSTTYQAVLNTQPTPTEGIWLEAECATVGTNWNTENQTDASGGSYVTIRSGLNSFSAAPTSANSHVRFNFTATESGAHHIFARARASNSSNDSFWLRLDGGSWQQWNVPQSGSAFSWSEINIISPSFSAASAHTIDIAYREDGTDLDKLLVSTSNTVPTGLGEAADNCEALENEAPSASFLTNPTAAFAPRIVNFDASNSSDDKGIVSYLWDFDDGSTGTGIQVSHTYEEAGVYNPSLTVVDAEGLEDTQTSQLTLAEYPYDDGVWLEAECTPTSLNWNTVNAADASGGQYVTIRPGLNSFSSAPTSIDSRLTFRFSTIEGGTHHIFARVRANNSSNDSFWVRTVGGDWQQWNVPQTGSSFAWREIVILSQNFEKGSAQTIEIAYREDGTDLDKLYVTSSSTPPSGMGEVDIFCNPPPSNYPPVASFTATPLSGNAPLVVNFDASASTDDDDIIGELWDFGDGTSGYGEFTSHTYTEAGEYEVVLYVEDRQGAYDYETLIISVQEPTLTQEIWLEAECGAVGANWNTESASDASEGFYLTARPGLNSFSNAPNNSDDYLAYAFTVSESGMYHFYARVRAPSGSDDSFWVRIDGGTWLQWNIGPRTSVFAWREVNVISPNFAAGSVHTLEVAYREDGTDLDKLYITQGTQAPTGLGESANNCNGGILNNAREMLSLKAYPNALEENADMIIESSKAFSPDVRATLFDLSGRVIMENLNISQSTFAPSSIRLDFSAIPLKQGVYYLSIEESAFRKPQVIRFLKK